MKKEGCEDANTKSHHQRKNGCRKRMSHKTCSNIHCFSYTARFFGGIQVAGKQKGPRYRGPILRCPDSLERQLQGKLELAWIVNSGWRSRGVVPQRIHVSHVEFVNQVKHVHDSFQGHAFAEPET